MRVDRSKAEDNTIVQYVSCCLKRYITESLLKYSITNWIAKENSACMIQYIVTIDSAGDNAAYKRKKKIFTCTTQEPNNHADVALFFV